VRDNLVNSHGIHETIAEPMYNQMLTERPCCSVRL